MTNMNSVAGVEAMLEQREAEYKEASKILLTGWQSSRKHLRALLDVLKDQATGTDTLTPGGPNGLEDRDAPPSMDSDTEE